MTKRLLRNVEKALESAARQLIAAKDALASLRASGALQAGSGSGRASSRGGRRGELLDSKMLRAGIFHFLQKSPGAMTTAQIMSALIESARLKFSDAHQKTNFSTRISIAMRRYEAQGVVKTVGQAGKGKPIRWALVKK
jgi:hypothetical protein